MINVIPPQMQQPQYRPNHRAPPPPRPLHGPNEKPTDIEGDIVKFEKKIRNTLIIVVFFVILFIIIGILSVTVHEGTYDGALASDEPDYGHEFNVWSATDSLPVKIETSASHKVDYFFIVTQENYDYNNENHATENDQRIANYEDNNEYMLQDTTKFVYEGELSTGDYVIVSFSEERSHTIQLDYKITRYYIQPILVFVLLIFIIIWVLLALRIYKLHQKKQDLEQQEEFGAEYAADNYEGYGAPPAPQPYYQQSQPYETQSPPPPPPPPPPSLQAPPTGRVYESPEPEVRPKGPRVVSGPRPMPRIRRRPPPPPPPPTSNPSENYEPLVINCKCGGSIRVDSPERPIEIKCPDCGRKGMVEASESPDHSGSDGYQYF